MGNETESGPSPLFTIGDRVEWGTRDAKCQCLNHNGKHRPGVVTVVSVPVPRPGGKITYAVNTDDGIAVADAKYLRKVSP